MNRPLAFLAALLLIAAPALTGCRPGGEGEHERGAEGGHEHHEEAEMPSTAITVHTGRTELFAEHDYLVAGRETSFAAHVTDLRDFSAVRSGRFEVVMRGPEGKTEIFSVVGVLRPGIFRPVAKPALAGTYDLSFRVSAPDLADTIPGGRITVYPDDKAAIAAAPEEVEDPDNISFLKEQQWKIAFATQLVAAGSLPDGLSLQGTVRSAAGREASVSAPESGLVVPDRGRQPRLGDRVSRGDVLAILTPAGGHGRDRAGLAAALKEAIATRKQAQTDLARAERLARAGAGPAKRVAELGTALDIARSSEEAAHHEYEAATAVRAGEASVTEDSFSLRSPISGTVVDSRLVPGSFVEAGTLLYRLVDLSEVWVEAKLPEADILRASAARTAEILPPGAPAGMAPLPGRLVTIGGAVDPQTRTAAAVYAVPNGKTLLRVGMSARVRALLGRTPVSPVVPRSAVVDDNGRPIAYVQTGGESFARRELTLGVTQGNRVQVQSGLAAGDRVVTQGAYEIRLSTLSDVTPAHGHAH
jgi:RND family efflux transporter MFP subunit